MVYFCVEDVSILSHSLTRVTGLSRFKKAQPKMCHSPKADILKVDFLCSQNFSFEILRKKKCKNITKNHLICVKHEEKTVK